MALHTATELYGSIFDLTGVAQKVILKMRRDARFIFGKRIIECCIQLDLHLRSANMAQEKEPHLLQLLEELEVIELLTRGCRDWGYIHPTDYGEIVWHTQSIGKQTNGWRKERGGSQQRLLL